MSSCSGTLGALPETRGRSESGGVRAPGAGRSWAAGTRNRSMPAATSAMPRSSIPRSVPGARGVAFGAGHRSLGVDGGDADLLELGRELGPLAFGLAEGALQRAMQLGQMRLRALEDCAVHPEPRRDGERVGGAREPDVQAE